MDTAPEKVSPSAVEAASERTLQIVNDAMLALQISIGHRTGLFDVMADLAPSTSEAIAEASGLQPRYVREWLGAMVTGGVAEYDPGRRTYWLPAEQAACLTRAAGPENLASLARFVALLGRVETEVVDCFRNGGGVPYSSYPEFQALMAEDSAQIHDAMLIDGILPLARGVPEALHRGVEVLDVGCGRGHAVNLMARAYPESRFTGIELSEDALGVARAEARDRGLSNAAFEVMDAATLDRPARYDLITAFDAIHDQADPAGVLSAIHRALRPGGTFLCVDIGASSELADNRDHPLGPFLYTVSTLHCTTVSLAQGGAGLGAMWGRQCALAMLAAAGFTDVTVERIDGDIANNYYIARKY